MYFHPGHIPLSLAGEGKAFLHIMYCSFANVIVLQYLKGVIRRSHWRKSRVFGVKRLVRRRKMMGTKKGIKSVIFNDIESHVVVQGDDPRPVIDHTQCCCSPAVASLLGARDAIFVLLYYPCAFY